MFQTKAVDKVKTHIFSSITFFRKSYRLWHNVENYGRAGQAKGDNIIRLMHFACSIIKTRIHTHTHTFIMFTTYCFSAATMVTRTRHNVTLYVHSLSCWLCGSITNLGRFDDKATLFAVICLWLPQLSLRLWLTILSNFQPYQCSHSQFPYAFWLKIAFITMVYLLSQNLATRLF
jgi:hypothetical protein